MRRVVLILFSLLFCCKVVLSQESNPLDSIQFRITKNFNEYFNSKNSTELDDIIKNLSKLKKQKDSRYINYWLAYALYNKAIIYVKIKDDKNAEKTLSKGIDLIEKVKHKTSEDYALLATLRNLDINFSFFFTIPFKAKKVVMYGEKSIELDNKNLRGYFALGANNFFTPKMYGGKLKCEEYFLKAISLKDKYTSNPFDPSWGKDESYYYLIRYYYHENKVGLMEKYMKESISLYPNSIRLNQIIENIKNAK